MSNLGELKEAKSNFRRTIGPTKTIDNFSLLNAMLSTYLPSIAKSLAIIADEMSEKDKED